MTTDKLAHQIDKSLRVVSEMLEYRGLENVKIPFGAQELIKSSKGYMIVPLLEPHNSIAIVYIFQETFSLNSTKSTIFDAMFTEELQSIKHYILILANGKTLPTHHMVKQERTIECWKIEELMYNPSKHSIVPYHKKMQGNESLYSNLMSAHGIESITQLPWILTNDPMARFVNAQDGDIVQVTRYAPTSGESIIFRYCKGI